MPNQAVALRMDLSLFAEGEVASEADVFGDATSEAGPADQAATPANEPGADQAQSGAGDEGEATGPDESATQEQLIFGRYKSIEEAQRGYNELRQQLSRDGELIKQLGGREAVQALLQQHHQPQQAQPAQPAEKRIETPWGALTPEEANAKYWELGPAVYDAEMRAFNARPQIKATNYQRVEQAMRRKYPDFDQVTQRLNEAAQQDPKLRDTVRDLLEEAALDPVRLANVAEVLYRAGRGTAAEQAVAAARKTGEQLAQARAEAQTSATVGGSGNRAVANAKPQSNPWDDLLGPAQKVSF